jgi:HEAT repeat protein
MHLLAPTWPLNFIQSKSPLFKQFGHGASAEKWAMWHAIRKGPEMEISREPDLMLVRKLVEKLSDKDPRVRRNAAGALRMQGIKAVEAVPAITRLLDDEDPRVRREAEQAIEQITPVAVRA